MVEACLEPYGKYTDKCIPSVSINADLLPTENSTEFCRSPMPYNLTLPLGCSVDGSGEIDVGMCSRLPCRLPGG